jgi:hypothetical protein
MSLSEGIEVLEEYILFIIIATWIPIDQDVTCVFQI